MRLIVSGVFSLEKYGKVLENRSFSGRIRPDWGNTARADMAGLGSLGLNTKKHAFPYHSQHATVLLDSAAASEESNNEDEATHGYKHVGCVLQ